MAGGGKRLLSPTRPFDAAAADPSGVSSAAPAPAPSPAAQPKARRCMQPSFDAAAPADASAPNQPSNPPAAAALAAVPPDLPPKPPDAATPNPAVPPAIVTEVHAPALPTSDTAPPPKHSAFELAAAAQAAAAGYASPAKSTAARLSRGVPRSRSPKPGSTPGVPTSTPKPGQRRERRRPNRVVWCTPTLSQTHPDDLCY